MKRTAKVIGSVALAGVAAVVVLGITWWLRPPELPPPPPMVTTAAAPAIRSGPPDLARRVFLDVNAADARQVFKRLCDTIPCRLNLDPQLRQPVTLRASNITAQTALRAICETIGCRWDLKGEVLNVTRDAAPPPIPPAEVFAEKMRTPLPDGMKFTNVRLGEVVNEISKASGIQIAVEDVDLSKPVTADVGGEQPLMALTRALRAAGIDLSHGFSGAMQFGVDSAVKPQKQTIRLRVHTKRDQP